MAKMKRNRIAVSGAEAAAAKGPFPDQPLQGKASMSGIRDNSMIGYFPNAKGPKGGRDHPMYPGTDIFQRLKLVTSGPKGTTDPREF
jgi:hypothetical protein